MGFLKIVFLCMVYEALSPGKGALCKRVCACMTLVCLYVHTCTQLLHALHFPNGFIETEAQRDKVTSGAHRVYKCQEQNPSMSPFGTPCFSLSWTGESVLSPSSSLPPHPQAQPRGPWTWTP